MTKISQNISSDILLHFIKRREWLIRVLKDKAFHARYVYEELPDGEETGRRRLKNQVNYLFLNKFIW